MLLAPHQTELCFPQEQSEEAEEETEEEAPMEEAEGEGDTEEEEEAPMEDLTESADKEEEPESKMEEEPVDSEEAAPQEEEGIGRGVVFFNCVRVDPLVADHCIANAAVNFVAVVVNFVAYLCCHYNYMYLLFEQAGYMCIL